ncbi:MAG: putative toxin [Chloroflexota bacterium]|nr:putative toxin [Chloroflexota bacterium]
MGRCCNAAFHLAGTVGWLVPGLLPAAGNVWGAMGLGMLSGSLAGGAGQVVANLLNPCVEWHQDLARTMIVGGVTGGIAGGAGYGIRRWQATGSLSSSPNAIGRVGERAAGVAGPKARIRSVLDPTTYRVPDQLDDTAQILREVKNVARLSYTSQLRDYALWAQQEGYRFILVVRQTTELSGPLRGAVQRGEIILEYLPW